MASTEFVDARTEEGQLCMVVLQGISWGSKLGIGLKDGEFERQDMVHLEFLAGDMPQRPW